MRLNRIEQLIIDDIREHPGSTQNQVIQRLIGKYSYSYLYNSLTRLKALNLIINDKEHNRAKYSLYINSKSA